MKDIISEACPRYQLRGGAPLPKPCGNCDCRFREMSRASQPVDTGVAVRIGQPCPPHQWSFSPTVGSFHCVKCSTTVRHNEPGYATVKAEYDMAAVERVRQHVEPGDPPTLMGDALRWYCSFDFGAPHSVRESNIAVEGYKDGYRAALLSLANPVGGEA